jgi:hypothetical protein
VPEALLDTILSEVMKGRDAAVRSRATAYLAAEGAFTNSVVTGRRRGAFSPLPGVFCREASALRSSRRYAPSPWQIRQAWLVERTTPKQQVMVWRSTRQVPFPADRVSSTVDRDALEHSHDEEAQRFLDELASAEAEFLGEFHCGRSAAVGDRCFRMVKNLSRKYEGNMREYA